MKRVVFVLCCAIAFADEIRFEDNDSKFHNSSREINGTVPATGDGRNLLHWITSFADVDTDPYLAKSNANCLEGDLAECFKAKALSSLDEFFTKESYTLNENTKLLRMPEEHRRSVRGEPFEYSTESRADEPEWDQFVKFMLRKVERFLKTNMLEVNIPDDVTDDGRYAPRFIDDIANELDAIEDKKASVFKKKKLKKLIIPLLLILKLFKLKLLLFLPLILGLASFKKLLGFLAIAVPGLIGFYKLCKPDLHHNYGSFGHSNYYNRPPHYARPDQNLYVNEYRATESPDVIQYLQDTYATGLNYGKSPDKTGPVAFRDDPQKLAYNGYQ